MNWRKSKILFIGWARVWAQWSLVAAGVTIDIRLYGWLLNVSPSATLLWWSACLAAAATALSGLIFMLLGKSIALKLLRSVLVDPASLDKRDDHLIWMIARLARQEGLTTIPSVAIRYGNDLDLFTVGCGEKGVLMVMSHRLADEGTEALLTGWLTPWLKRIAQREIWEKTMLQGGWNLWITYPARVLARLFRSNNRETRLTRGVESLISLTLLILGPTLFTLPLLILMDRTEKIAEHSLYMNGLVDLTPLSYFSLLRTGRKMGDPPLFLDFRPKKGADSTGILVSRDTAPPRMP